MYLNEIQNAKITWNDGNKNPFTYNDYGDHHNYRTALMQKEMDFIQEYQSNTIFAKSPFSEKMYLTYLNRARLFFIFEDNGEIKHQNLYLNSGYPLLTDHPHRQDIEKMLRDVEEIQKLEWKPGENEKTVSMVITTEEKTDIREKLFYMMAEAKMPILNMQFTKVSLEDIFLELTQNETAPVPDEQDTKPESAPEDETGTDTEKENETEQEAHDESNL